MKKQRKRLFPKDNLEVKDLLDGVHSNEYRLKPWGKRTIGLLHAFCLVYMFFEALTYKDIGYMDADYGYLSFLKKLQKIKVTITTDVLERTLWACNTLDEIKKFKHPFDINFNTFVKKLLYKDERYDRMFNYIIRKKEEK